MRPVLPALLLTLPVACATPTKTASSSTTGAASTAKAAQDCTGVFAPVQFEAISIWPEAFKGEMVVLEVVEHGTPVREGEAVVRLDTRAIDEAVQKAELEARSAKVRHTSLVERQGLEEQAARTELERARAGLDRARRALAGWKEREIVFAQRSAQLQSRREQAWVDDQVDELTQLRAMYEADELTDATEEIVLKRAERDLEVTRIQTALGRDRRVFTEEVTRTLDTESREEKVRKQADALERTLKTQAIDRRDREDARARSAATLEEQETKLARLRRDRESFVTMAPRDGVVLHGKIDQYRPGAAPTKLERGSSVSPRKQFLMVAAPAPVAVALEVPEAMRQRAQPGSTVTVRPVADPERTLGGKLDLESFPGAKGEQSFFIGSVALDHAEGVVFGMRAKVELAGGGS